MGKLPALSLAVLIGCLTEVALCVVGIASIFSGGFGPCGPSGDFPGWLVLIHLPGVWIAESLLPRGGFADVPIMLVTTSALLSTVAYVVILFVRRWVRRFCANGRGREVIVLRRVGIKYRGRGNGLTIATRRNSR